jgi:hypothetical protein
VLWKRRVAGPEGEQRISLDRGFIIPIHGLPVWVLPNGYLSAGWVNTGDISLHFRVIAFGTEVIRKGHPVWMALAFCVALLVRLKGIL